MGIYAETDGTQNGQQRTIRHLTADYTVSSRDNGAVLELNAASDKTFTFPIHLGEGFWCIVYQIGAGKAIIAGSGTTINSNGGHTKTSGQWARATVESYKPDFFILAGDTV